MRDWTKCLNLENGVLHDVLKLMKHKSVGLAEFERLTVLTFDEIHISNRICIVTSTEQKLGPHKTCQTVMARGLIGQWK